MARKILVADIETSPHLCYSFQTYNTNISPAQVIEPTRMISFAAGWADKRAVEFHSEYEGFGPYPTREACHQHMVEQAHRLLDEADVFVHYNGDRFDVLHMNREFELAGLKPPSPYISVDLYRVFKKNQVYAFHKLAWITEQLQLSGKMDNSGWRLWRNVLSEDEEVRRKAWLEMRRYNKQDVVTTRELFHRAKHLITNLPSPHLFDENVDELSCSSCEGTNVQRRGYAVKQTRKYPRFQCTDCGRWSQGTRSVGSVALK